MTRDTRLEQDILQAIADYNGPMLTLEPVRLYDTVNCIKPDEYATDEFYACLRRIAGDGLIHTPQELKPLLSGGGLSGTISPMLPIGVQAMGIARRNSPFPMGTPL